MIKTFLNPEGHHNPISGFKSYGHFSEGLDFAYWWSFIGKGLRLQPAQQACFDLIMLQEVGRVTVAAVSGVGI